MKQSSEEKTYCITCCKDTIHITNDEHEIVCSVCQTLLSHGIIERDEQIEILAFENKMMSEALRRNGFSDEYINKICTGQRK